MKMLDIINENRKRKLDINHVIKFLKTNKAYEILDNSEANGTTFQSGGCLILADALSLYYDVPLFVVFNTSEKRSEHFVVKVGSMYLDSDGLQSEKEILNKVSEEGFYDIKNLTLLPFHEDMRREGIIRDLFASKLFVATFMKLEKKF